MSFAHPQLLFLLLLVPAMAKYLWISNRKTLNILRILLMLLIVFFFAGPRLDLTETGVDVIAIVDRSASVGSDGKTEEKELLQLLGGSSSRSKDDRLAVISFGAKALVESLPVNGPVSTGFERDPGGNASNISQALSLAARRVSPRRRTRILLLSDGVFTGEDPLNVSILSQLENTPVWYRPVGKKRLSDVTAGTIVLPSEVSAGSGFLVRFSINSPSTENINYILRRGDQVLASGNKTIGSGDTNFFARDIAPGNTGVIEYKLEITSRGDTRVENNVSSGLLRVTTAPRVLLVTGKKSSGDEGVLAKLLASASIPFDRVMPYQMQWNVAKLAPYRVVILENVLISQIGEDGAKALAQAVQSGVAGLLVTGGEASFGNGGYHKSPLDKLLPVTMELREEQRRGLMAMVAVLDRSGSMNMEAASGRTKMELANAGVAEAVRLMSPLDEVSVIAVDSSAHTIIPLVMADDTTGLVKTIGRIRSQGGGIFVKTALDASVKQIEKSKLPTRHILLFSDANDSEEQEGCIRLAKNLKKQGIGISVIGLGTTADSDAQFLKDLAKAGGGEAYFTNRPEELPRVFSQEVIRVSQRGYVNEPSDTKLLPDIVRLRLKPGLLPPTVGAYNLTSLRKGASCALITDDDYSAPLVAFWQKGRASVGALTAEIDGPSSAQLLNWEHSGKLIINLVRNIAAGVTVGEAKSYSSMQRGRAQVRFEVEKKVAHRLRTKASKVRFLGPDGIEPIEVPLRWDKDVAIASAGLSVPGHYLPVIDLGEEGIHRAAPVTLPYSPEFAPEQGIEGNQVLNLLSKATGGKKLVRVDEIFEYKKLKYAPAGLDLTWWILLTTIGVLLLEIAEKRLVISELIIRWLGKLKRDKRGSV